MELKNYTNALDKVTKVDPSTVGLGPWSYSKLKSLKNCPFRFYLQYILKVKPPEEIPYETFNVGKAAHRILELILEGKPIEDAYSITRGEFEFTDVLWNERIASVRPQIESFQKRIEVFSQESNVVSIKQELKLGCTKNWKKAEFFGDDVYFRGVVDTIIEIKSEYEDEINDGKGNDILIIDHKYGAPPEAGLRNYTDQLNIYKILYNNGFAPIRGAQAGIHYIKAGEVKLGDYHTQDEIVSSLIRRLEFFIESIVDKVLEFGYFKHISCNDCKICDYRDDCKSGKLKEIEKSSKVWFAKKL